MSRLALAAVLLAGVAACSQTNTSTSSSAVAPAAPPPASATSGTPAVASPAAPADASGAEAFLRQVLHRYVNPAPPPTQAELNAAAPTQASNETTAQFAEREARENAQTFTPEIVDLMRRDRLSTPEGDVGVMDFDPLCMCQDDSGIRLRTITTAPGENGRVVATAIFSTESPQEPRLTHVYTLERTPAGWRIANIVDQQVADGISVNVLDLLRNGVAEQERAQRAAPTRRR